MLLKKNSKDIFIGFEFNIIKDKLDVYLGKSEQKEPIYITLEEFYNTEDYKDLSASYKPQFVMRYVENKKKELVDKEYWYMVDEHKGVVKTIESARYKNDRVAQAILVLSSSTRNLEHKLGHSDVSGNELISYKADFFKSAKILKTKIEKSDIHLFFAYIQRNQDDISKLTSIGYTGNKYNKRWRNFVVAMHETTEFVRFRKALNIISNNAPKDDEIFSDNNGFVGWVDGERGKAVRSVMGDLDYLGEWINDVNRFHPQDFINMFKDVLSSSIKFNKPSQEEIEDVFRADTTMRNRLIIEFQKANRNVYVASNEDMPIINSVDMSRIVGDNEYTGTEALKNFINSNGKDFNLSMIDFHSQIDVEGQGKVEIKSKPVTFSKAMDLKHNMFNLIRAIGATEHHAGLHTNVSIRGEKFSDSNLNAAKIVTLVDYQFMRELFPVRNYVNMTLFIDKDQLFYLAREHTNQSLTNPSYFLDRYEDKVDKVSKNQGINFNHMGENRDTRRIEFRFIGGDDYVNRESIVDYAIYKIVYVIRAGFDEDFLKKDYYRSVIKTMDGVVKKYYPQFSSFVEMSQTIKKHDIMFAPELKHLQ